MLSRIVNKVFEPFGYQLIKKTSKLKFPIEINKEEREFISEILFPIYKKENLLPLSMVSVERLWAAISATKYLVENDIDGDMVECGVWRGGCSIAIAKTLKKLGSSKKVYLYDTFAGMTSPTTFDRNALTKDLAIKKFRKMQNENHNKWCYASLEDVKNSFMKYNILDKAVFVKGDVNNTLNDLNNLPNNISLLRLDTDWYESTKKELEILYPLLQHKGILMVDDYGHWEGARKAVDEYIRKIKPGNKPMQWVIDYTGRGYIK